MDISVSHSPPPRAQHMNLLSQLNILTTNGRKKNYQKNRELYLIAGSTQFPNSPSCIICFDIRSIYSLYEQNTPLVTMGQRAKTFLNNWKIEQIFPPHIEKK